MSQETVGTGLDWFDCIYQGHPFFQKVTYAHVSSALTQDAMTLFIERLIYSKGGSVSGEGAYAELAGQWRLVKVRRLRLVGVEVCF